MIIMKSFPIAQYDGCTIKILSWTMQEGTFGECKVVQLTLRGLSDGEDFPELPAQLRIEG
jgi:hypothetical protein